MQIKNVLTGLVGLAVLADAASIERRSPFGRALERRQRGQNGGNKGNQGNQGNNQAGNANTGNANTGGAITLDSNLVQTGSQQNGNNPGGDGQVASATDKENFINFCSGKTLTNGAQVKTGSCNGIPMGNIPSVNNMVSSLFVNPQNGDNLASNQTFNIQVQMINFAPGSFTNATTTYYSAPQDVDGSGNIIGHTHVTVQSMGNSQTPSQPLDPQSFVFFKGINDAGNGNGLLSATVTGGLPAGNYRLCSMSAAANHQPVLMPVAQRGAQDDCVRFTVSNNGNGGNNANNGNGNAGTGTNNAGTGTNNAGTGTNNAGTGNNNGQTGQNNGQTGQNNGQTGQNGAGSTNNAGTGSVQTGDNNNNGTAAATGQNGQGQNNGQTGQTGQTGQAGQAGEGGRRGGRKGGKGGKGGNNAQAATSVAAGNAAPAATSAAAVSNAASGAGGATTANALGGIAAPPVTQSGNADRPFEVQGNTFTTKAAAAQRACDIQNNQCANAVNSKSINGVSVGDCNNQIAACVAGLSASS